MGRRQIPFGLKLPDGKVIRGVLWSNELDHHPDRNDRILLLSLKAQATLGLVKDVRQGNCVLKDYGQSIPLYEVIGNDLRAICISDVEDHWEAAQVVAGEADDEEVKDSTSSHLPPPSSPTEMAEPFSTP